MLQDSLKSEKLEHEKRDGEHGIGVVLRKNVLDAVGIGFGNRELVLATWHAFVRVVLL